MPGNSIVRFMPAFTSSVDIGQRVLQHCGAQRMDPILGFSDTTNRGAGEILSCYNQLREAELRRNYWTFAIKEAWLRAIDVNSMSLAPALWSALTTYFRGSIVADQSNNLWISLVADNLGNDPLLTTSWEPYYGPLSVPLYDSTIAYGSGELVYTAAGDGTYKVYLSLISGNSDVPGTATAWSATTTYFKDQVVTVSAVAYLSLIDLNINNSPASAPALFNIATTYAAGNKVGGSDGIIYTSIGSGNLGHDPTLDGGLHWTAGALNPWTTVFTGGTGSLNWLQIGGSGSPSGVALVRATPIYPVGSGPAQQTWSKNVFRLPSGYLRRAPDNPKMGTTPLGGPSGLMFDDWVVENIYITSTQTGPLRLRFAANVTDVRRMDPMFCEGLAARIAIAVAPTVTQNNTDVSEIASEYQKFMSEARLIGAIEAGSVDPPDDTYITVRY